MKAGFTEPMLLLKTEKLPEGANIREPVSRPESNSDLPSARWGPDARCPQMTHELACVFNVGAERFRPAYIIAVVFTRSVRFSRRAGVAQDPLRLGGTDRLKGL
jgi:hypothetical protein